MGEKRVSRRQFFRGAAAITGAGVIASRASAAQDGATTFCLPSSWQRTSDVVIVGFGAAGASAAYEAAAAGASVTVLDISSAGGGDTILSGGYVFIGGGTGLQRDAGLYETPDQMYAVVRAMGGPGADPEIIRTWCQSGPELYDWLTTKIRIGYNSGGLMFGGMEQHAEFKALAPGGAPVRHSHLHDQASPSGGGGERLFRQLSSAALGTGRVTLRGQMKATRLIQDPNSKRILGVAAKPVDQNGAVLPGAHEQYFKATRGVVVATGSFSANPDMIARHNPTALGFTQWSQRNADGSGIRMVQEVGGDVHMMKVFWALVYFAANTATMKGILVSTKGSRFVAEDEGYVWLAHHMIAEQQTAYLIYDQSILSLGGNLFEIPNPLAANSIEALAAAINQRDNVGMPPQLLRATLDGYNALANSDGRSGSDPAFLKDPSNVLPIVTPPFYAAKYTSMDAMGTTGGGLRVSPRSEVLDPDGDPIPGLYAAGTCASLTMSERYTGAGTAIAGALVFGRIAGKNAARRCF